MADITEETFQAEVVDRSSTVPVVIDLWAEWCGPCKTLGPILEKVIGETNGLVELAKVDVESNPQISAAFQVQSIPAVYAMKDGAIVDGFVGALPEAENVQFVQRLLDGSVTTAEPAQDGQADGADEAQGPQGAVMPGAQAPAPTAPAPAAVPTISEPGMPPAAMAEAPAPAPVLSDADAATIETELGDLLPKVKDDDDARARYLELLEQLGAQDPRTNTWRRKLATALF